MGLAFGNFCISCSRHGELKNESRYNAWVSFFALIVIWVLYYWAGFFQVFTQN